MSRLIAANALSIPVNKIHGSNKPPRLLIADKQNEPFEVGSMQFRLLGPGEHELKRLREGWNKYLALDNKNDFKWKSEEGVTMSNVASIMFLVEEAGKRLLLTGDGLGSYVIAGLERLDLLNPDGSDGIHVDALKVQHHGSDHNIDEDFCRRVSADTYIFCGNGHSTNPEIKVIDDIYASRLGKASQLTLAEEAEGRPFKMVFSTSAALEEENETPAKQVEHMRKVEKRVKTLAAKSVGLMSYQFNKGNYFDLTV